jgi:hypothetical protein
MSGMELRFLGLLVDSLVTLAQPTWQHKFVRIRGIIERTPETEFAVLDIVKLHLIMAMDLERIRRHLGGY